MGSTGAPGVDRRSLLGLGLAAPSVVAAAPALAQSPPSPAAPPDWNRLRGQWDLDWSEVDLSAMLFAANPKPVREAVARHRAALGRNPITYLEANNRRLQNAARVAAGTYFDVPVGQVGLCESTTAGIALVYAGLDLRYGQEVLTTVHDYYVTHEALRLAARRNGASIRKIALHEGARLPSACRRRPRLASVQTGLPAWHR